jgi:hypothetical protein
LGFGEWIKRVFRGVNPDDESAEGEELHLGDPGTKALRSDPAPSLLGGIDPPVDGEQAPPDLAP